MTVAAPATTQQYALDRLRELIAAGARHTFDSFECAIHTLAPKCTHCGVPIIGHGSEHQGAFYCRAHCAARAGVKEIRDRA